MTTTTMPATVKDAAAAIRQDLRAAFPGTRFSVRKVTGTASAWIDVAWTNGPNDDMVRGVTDRYTEFGSPVEGISRERHITMATLLKAQDLIRTVLPDFEVYDSEGRWLLSARPDTVEIFHLKGWRFGGGSASAALREVADVCILNPRTGPGFVEHRPVVTETLNYLTNSERLTCACGWQGHSTRWSDPDHAGRTPGVEVSPLPPASPPPPVSREVLRAAIHGERRR